VVPSQLVELAQQALTDVRISVANGEPLVRCQLLASEFHEALKRALRAPELSPVERCAVIAAANQCLHAANASISPGAMVLELRAAIAMLQFNGATPPRRNARAPVEVTVIDVQYLTAGLTPRARVHAALRVVMAVTGFFAGAS
jgi:hypothetical protein